MYFFQLPDQENIISLKLREEARTAFLQKKSKDLLNNTELQVTRSHLRKMFIIFSTFFLHSEPVDFIR